MKFIEDKVEISLTVMHGVPGTLYDVGCASIPCHRCTSNRHYINGKCPACGSNVSGINGDAFSCGVCGCTVYTCCGIRVKRLFIPTPDAIKEDII